MTRVPRKARRAGWIVVLAAASVVATAAGPTAFAYLSPGKSIGRSVVTVSGDVESSESHSPPAPSGSTPPPSGSPVTSPSSRSPRQPSPPPVSGSTGRPEPEQPSPHERTPDQPQASEPEPTPPPLPPSPQPTPTAPEVHESPAEDAPLD